MPTIQESSLVEFTTALFLAAGVEPAEARIVAVSLVEANLRGHDSHGVMRAPFYIQKVQDGSLNPKAHLMVEKESASSIVADGGWGLGQVLAQELMTKLIAKCETSAIACGTIRRAAHIDAVLRLTLGDDAWGLGITFFYIEIKSISTHM